jgi:salicylate hydroxylase
MDSSEQLPFRILIVGAGIAGLGASIVLALRGHKVTVIERTAALQGIGGGMMLFPQVCKILDYYGVVEKVMATDCIPDKLVICRYADGSVIGVTNFAWQKEVFGYR